MFSSSRFNPGTGIADFWQEFRKPTPYRWAILAVSALPFATILYWANGETVYIPPAKPEVTYITSYAPDRSDEEIVASNLENQRRKDALAAKRAEIEEKKRQMYRELGRATGLDVDAMEGQIEEERAAQEAVQTNPDRSTGEAIADSAE